MKYEHQLQGLTYRVTMISGATDSGSEGRDLVVDQSEDSEAQYVTMSDDTTQQHYTITSDDSKYHVHHPTALHCNV